MATPVSIETPPHGHLRTGSEQERDLQAKMQHMISLQYQEQKISNSNCDLTGDGENQTDFAGYDNSNSGGGGGGGLTLSKRKNAMTNTNLQGLGDVGVDTGGGAQPLHPSTGDISMDIPLSNEHPDVGKGTIVFSGNLRDSKYATGGGGNMEDNTSPSREYIEQQQQQQQQYLQLNTMPNIQQQQQQQQQQYQQQMSPQSTLASREQQQQQQHLLSSGLPQQIYSGYGSVQEQNHEFHYGNPDYHNVDDQDYYYEDEHRRYQQDDSNCFVRMFACLYRPIAYLLSQENLHRSFCYGAIDGLLTGSGIASAFWGLGLLSVRTRIELRITVVAFTVAACIADSLCMAMGHVWTTYIVTSNHAWERSTERQLLEHDKADSKGKLVDMLLARGMLKIDAMSLADTLEGYPDLFVSALVGDSLLSSGIQDALLDERTEDGYQQQQQQQQNHRYNPCQSAGDSDPAMGCDGDGDGGFLGSFGSWKFPMHYDSDRGEHHNLEGGHVRVVYHESQKEGLFMMMGFAFFSVIPSLLWLFLPMWFNNAPPMSSNKLSSSSTSSSGIDDAESVNIPSLIILILSSVIWCLGVWKSYFVDSNWIVFGLETIAVLMVCISSAYGIAALFVYCLDLDDPFNDVMLLSDEWNLPPTTAPSSIGL